MHAPAYHCPACGGPQRHAGPGRCDFCGSVRVPLGTPDPRDARPCPDCAALVAAHYQFCPKCGAVQGETETPLEHSDLDCPGCHHRMSIWPLDPRLSGSSYRGVDPQIQGCQSCGGAWVDRRTLEAIIAEARRSEVVVAGRDVPRKTMAMAEVVVYRPCPRCSVRMNRRNFGRYSGVVVDECPSCGTYFDAGELEGVVAFVRAGGLTLTEQRQAEEAKRELAHRRQINTTAPSGVPMSIAGFSKPISQTELELLVGFLRWLGRWIRRLAR